MKKIIKNHYTIDLITKENPYDLDEKSLYEMATRCNPKRRFLFVSKLLGKHIAVDPKRALASSRILAMRYYEVKNQTIAHDHKDVLEMVKYGTCDCLKQNTNGYKIEENTIVIGFAETATGLAHGVFDALKNAKGFYHTTRENLKFDGKTLRFEEEHSHATSHIIYEKENLQLKNAKKIILVDDEISTGNTLLNIMISIKEQFNIKSFDVLTLLDWRNEDSCNKFDLFAKENDLNLEVFSLVKGEFKNVENGELELSKIKENCLFKDDIMDTKLDANLEKKVVIDELSDIDLEMKKTINNEEIYSYNGYTGRFGLNKESHEILIDKLEKISNKVQEYVSGKTLILGTEEFMYIPMKIAANLTGDIYYKSTTRSPIFPLNEKNYPINSGIKFKSIYNPNVVNYIYNIEQENYDTILVFVEKTNKEMNSIYLYNELLKYCSNIRIIYLEDNKKNELSYPPIIGSYKEDDIIFLLKKLNGQIKEKDNKSREIAIQSGIHYSEMLPIEENPSEEYLKLFYNSLEKFSNKLALAVGVTAEKILKSRGTDVVLVSLARAGSPAGILIKRYINKFHKINWMHYSISIIRGRGIDQNALKFIVKRHPNAVIQFVDGWTGKGSITKELNKSIDLFNENNGKNNGLKYELAVLADPGNCAEIYGTREDFMIPHACLNSTVSGLLSRTIYREDLIKSNDYHGVKYYEELRKDDLSRFYIKKIEEKFESVFSESIKKTNDFDLNKEEINWTGFEDVKNIRRDFNIESIHFIKPGIGETTRVLLRRIPWKILIKKDATNIEHIIQLAKEKNILVENYPLKAYQCCGLIKSLKGE